MKNKYRVVTDEFLGYEAQVKFWWFPFWWFQMDDLCKTNTFSSLSKAEDFIESKKIKIVKEIG